MAADTYDFDFDVGNKRPAGRGHRTSRPTERMAVLRIIYIFL